MKTLAIPILALAACSSTPDGPIDWETVSRELSLASSDLLDLAIELEMLGEPQAAGVVGAVASTLGSAAHSIQTGNRAETRLALVRTVEDLTRIGDELVGDDHLEIRAGLFLVRTIVRRIVLYLPEERRP